MKKSMFFFFTIYLILISCNSVYSDEYLCEGNYLILQNNKIKMHFDCNESQILATYDIYLDKEFLILTPNPSSCDEGCAEKFEKIN